MTRAGRLAATGLVAATLTLAGGTAAEAASASYSPAPSSSSTSDNGSWTKGDSTSSAAPSSSSTTMSGDNGSWTKSDNGSSKGKSHGDWPKGAPHTGDGASMLSSTGNVATGATLAAAGLGVGAFALRRRRVAQSN